MSNINGMPFKAFACIPDTRMIVADFLARRMQRLEGSEPDVEVYTWPQRDNGERRNITAVFDVTSTLCAVYVNNSNGYFLADPVEQFMEDVRKRHVQLPGEHEIYKKRSKK